MQIAQPSFISMDRGDRSVFIETISIWVSVPLEPYRLEFKLFITKNQYSAYLLSCRRSSLDLKSAGLLLTSFLVPYLTFSSYISVVELKYNL